MTTNLWSDASTHTNDATFRALGLKVSDSFTAIGFPKSADTGQINWATVSRPAEYSAAGYEVRYLNDSLHATSPIYVKLEYGRSNYSAANTLVLWITIGTGTNGAGTITGAKIAKKLVVPASAGGSGTVPWYFCCKDGYVAVSAAHGASDVHWFFAICRTCDDAGAINSEGVMFYYMNGGTSCYRAINCGSEINDGLAYCFMPGAATVTAVGANKQAVRHYAMQPTIRCVPFLLTYIDSEIGSESTFAAVTSGVASRTFLTLGGTSGPTNASMNNTASHRLAMQYD